MGCRSIGSEMRLTPLETNQGQGHVVEHTCAANASVRKTITAQRKAVFSYPNPRHIRAHSTINTRSERKLIENMLEEN